MKYILKKIILFYHKFISPMLPRTCKFIPTCSQYAYQAINKYGAIKGTYLSILRILRCNPFNKGGYDPLK